MAAGSELRFITRKVTGLILTGIVIFLILIGGLRLPMSISFTTRDFHNEVMALQPGDVVLIANNNDLGGYFTRFRSWWTAPIIEIARRGAKMIFANFIYGGGAVSEAVVGPANAGIEKKFGYKYGVDYVILPWVAAGDVSYAAVANDFFMFSTDYYGNPLDTLPLMQKAKSIRDCKLGLGAPGIDVTTVMMIVRQWCQAYGLRMIVLTSFTAISVYYGKYIFGDLDGTLGAAEYQYMTGIPGDELIKMDARNISLAISSVLIISGNIIYWSNRRRKKVVV